MTPNKPHSKPKGGCTISRLAEAVRVPIYQPYFTIQQADGGMFKVFKVIDRRDDFDDRRLRLGNYFPTERNALAMLHSKEFRITRENEISCLPPDPGPLTQKAKN